jgi:hypothetical protein
MDKKPTPSPQSQSSRKLLQPPHHGRAGQFISSLLNNIVERKKTIAAYIYRPINEANFV